MALIKQVKTIEENTNQHHPLPPPSPPLYETEDEVPTLIIHSSSPPLTTPSSSTFGLSATSQQLNSTNFSAANLQQKQYLSLNLQINQNYLSSNSPSVASVISTTSTPEEEEDQTEELIDNPSADFEFQSFKSVSNQYFDTNHLAESFVLPNLCHQSNTDNNQDMNAINYTTNPYQEQQYSQDSQQPPIVEEQQQQPSVQSYIDNENLVTSPPTTATNNNGGGQFESATIYDNYQYGGSSGVGQQVEYVNPNQYSSQPPSFMSIPPPPPTQIIYDLQRGTPEMNQQTFIHAPADIDIEAHHVKVDQAPKPSNILEWVKENRLLTAFIVIAAILFFYSAAMVIVSSVVHLIPCILATVLPILLVKKRLILCGFVLGALFIDWVMSSLLFYHIIRDGGGQWNTTKVGLVFVLFVQEMITQIVGCIIVFRIYQKREAAANNSQSTPFSYNQQ